MQKSRERADSARVGTVFHFVWCIATTGPRADGALHYPLRTSVKLAPVFEAMQGL